MEENKTANTQTTLDYASTLDVLTNIEKTRQTVMSRKAEIAQQIAALEAEGEKIELVLKQIGRPATRRLSSEESAARVETVRKAMKAAIKAAKGPVSVSEVTSALPEGSGLGNTEVAAAIRKMADKDEVKTIGERRNMKYEFAAAKN